MAANSPYARSNARNWRGDVAYWRLGLRQQAYFYGRISAYYGRELRRLDERAERLSRHRRRLLAISAAALALALALQVVGWWFA